MFNTIDLPNITEAAPPLTTAVSSLFSRSFTNLEKTLFYGIGAISSLFILQSICFIVFIIRVRRKRRRKREISLISNVREPLSNEENNSARYSSRPLKQVSDPQIYESLKDLIESEDAAPPLPSISTLPKRKPDKTCQLLDISSNSADTEDRQQVNTIATRPRLPLPSEVGAPPLSPKNNNFATMPRLPLNKPVPTPIMSSTWSRTPNRDSPHTNIRHIGPPKKPKPNPISLSSGGHHIPVISPPDCRTLPKTRSPIEIQNRTILTPSEPNHEIPVENELLQKLKKRAQLIPLSPPEIPDHQLTNNPTLTQPQRIKQEPYIVNELLQKLKKRAALIPDAQNQQRMNSASRVQMPKFKPLPPTPRHSDYDDGWVDNFDTIEPLEQINMYNV